MKIKTLFIILILGMVGNTSASDSFPQGIYVGLGGGYNKTGSRFLGETTENDAGEPNKLVPNTKRKNLNSFLITGFLGYMHVIKEYSLTLTGELFSTYLTGNQKFNMDRGNFGPTTATLDSKFRLKNEYGFKFMLGYLINNINHVYGILGLSNKNYNEKITSTFIDGADIDQTTLSKNFSKIYFLMGVGFERAFDNIKYGIEGIYQIGNKKTSLTHLVDLQNNAPGFHVLVPGARKLENSYTVIFKISYSFDVFH